MNSIQTGKEFYGIIWLLLQYTSISFVFSKMSFFKEKIITFLDKETAK